LGESVFLDRRRTASLATADAEGRPHAANVQYVRGDGLSVCWVSDPGSRHSLDIAGRAEVALTIYSHDDGVAESIHGLQLHGAACDLTGDERREPTLELYLERFPFVRSMPGALEQVRSGGQRLYRCVPTWARWIDNRRAFGWKAECDL